MPHLPTVGWPIVPIVWLFFNFESRLIDNFDAWVEERHGSWQKLEAAAASACGGAARQKRGDAVRVKVVRKKRSSLLARAPVADHGVHEALQEPSLLVPVSEPRRASYRSV